MRAAASSYRAEYCGGDFAPHPVTDSELVFEDKVCLHSTEQLLTMRATHHDHCSIHKEVGVSERLLVGKHACFCSDNALSTTGSGRGDNIIPDGSLMRKSTQSSSDDGTPAAGVLVTTCSAQHDGTAMIDDTATNPLCLLQDWIILSLSA